MYKIAVMGDVASVLGFKALGLDVYPVAGPRRGTRRSTGWPGRITPLSI